MTAQFRVLALSDLWGGTSMTSRDVLRIVSVAVGGGGFGCAVVPAFPPYVFSNGLASATDFKLGYMVTCSHNTDMWCLFDLVCSCVHFYSLRCLRVYTHASTSARILP